MHDFEKQPSEIKRGLLPNLPCDITVYSSDDSFRELHIDGEKDIQMGSGRQRSATYVEPSQYNSLFNGV